MQKSIYEMAGIGGVVFVVGLIIFILGLKLDIWLSLILSGIAGLIAWQLTKKK